MIIISILIVVITDAVINEEFGSIASVPDEMFQKHPPGQMFEDGCRIW